MGAVSDQAPALQEGLPAGGAGGISGPLAAAPVQGLPGPSQQSVDVLPGSSGVLSLPLDFLQGAGVYLALQA